MWYKLVLKKVVFISLILREECWNRLISKEIL